MLKNFKSIKNAIIALDVCPSNLNNLTEISIGNEKF